MKRARSIVGNPIIRRIRRHSSFSTLFHSYTPAFGPHLQRSVIAPYVIYLPGQIQGEEKSTPQETGSLPAFSPAIPITEAPASTQGDTVQAMPSAIRESFEDQQIAMSTITTEQPKRQGRNFPDIFRKLLSRRTIEKKIPEQRPKSSEVVTKAPSASPTESETGKVTQTSVSGAPVKAFEIKEPGLVTKAGVQPITPEQTLRADQEAPVESGKRITALETQRATVLEDEPELEPPFVLPSEPETEVGQHMDVSKAPVLPSLTEETRITQEVRQQHAPVKPLLQPSIAEVARKEPEVGSYPAPSQPPVQAHLVAPVETGREISATVPPPPASQAVAESSRTVASENRPDTEDPSWRRLQTIMRKHEQKQASEKTEAEIETAAGQDQVPKQETSSATPVGKPLDTQERDLLTTPSISPLKPSAKLDKIIEPEAIATSDFENEGNQTIHVEQPGETKTEQALPLEAVWPVQRKDTTPNSIERITQPADVSSPALPFNSPVSADGEAVLREVVQRTKTSQPTESHVEVILPKGPRPASPFNKPNQPAVSPDSAPKSDFGIPVVQPTEQTTGISQGQAVERLGSSRSPDVSPPDSVQRTQEGVSRENPLSSIEQPPIETEQWQEVNPLVGSISESPEREVPEGYVQTEIGPLPSDLWHLLGQPPPGKVSNQTANAGGQPVTVIQRKPEELPAKQTSIHNVQGYSDLSPTIEVPSPETVASSRGAPVIPVQRAVLPGQRSIQSEREQIEPPEIHYEDQVMANPASSVEEMGLPSIQRTVESAQVGSSVADASAGSLEEQKRAFSLSAGDLDELARQVYAEIRQKLSIERERLRRRS